MRKYESRGIMLRNRILSTLIVAFGVAAVGVGVSSVAASGTPAAVVAPSSGCVSVDQPIAGNADASWATGCARLAAYRGRAVWSARAASGGYVLMTATVGGAVPVPAVASVKPLGVSIGPGIAGHPTAIASVYSGDRYRIRAYDFVTSSVRTVLPGTSNTSTAPLYPAIDGSLVAYAPRGVVGVRNARGPRVCRLGGPCTQLPAGPPITGEKLGKSGPRRAGVLGLALVGHRLAMTWLNQDASAPYSQTLILYLPDALSRRAPHYTVVASAAAGGAGSLGAFSPSIAGGRVSYVVGGFACDFPASPHYIGRWDPRTRRHTRVVAPNIASAVTEGPRTWALSCPPPAIADSAPTALSLL
jgi:hypothetical protein